MPGLFVAKEFGYISVGGIGVVKLSKSPEKGITKFVPAPSTLKNWADWEVQVLRVGHT